MNKKLLEQNGFKHDKIHDEFYYERNDIEGIDNGEGKVHWFGTYKDRVHFKSNDSYRCEFLQNKRRMGKIHYDAIRFIYSYNRKPRLEIFIQGGMRLHIYRNEIKVSQFEPVDDNNFLYVVPLFDTISFYSTRSGLEMKLKLIELRNYK